MKQKIDTLSLALFFIIFFLLICIIAGTIAALSGSYANRNNAHKDQPVLSQDQKMFTEFGTLRAMTKEPSPSLILITPVFPYPAQDSPFQEELMQKKESLRIGILNWFSIHTIQEIKKTDEKEIKKELLEIINDKLVLGKIKTLYFEEYQVFD